MSGALDVEEGERGAKVGRVEGGARENMEEGRGGKGIEEDGRERDRGGGEGKG